MKGKAREKQTVEVSATSPEMYTAVKSKYGLRMVWMYEEEILTPENKGIWRWIQKAKVWNFSLCSHCAAITPHLEVQGCHISNPPKEFRGLANIICTKLHGEELVLKVLWGHIFPFPMFWENIFGSEWEVVYQKLSRCSSEGEIRSNHEIRKLETAGVNRLCKGHGPLRHSRSSHAKTRSPEIEKRWRKRDWGIALDRGVFWLYICNPADIQKVFLVYSKSSPVANKQSFDGGKKENSCVVWPTTSQTPMNRVKHLFISFVFYTNPFEAVDLKKVFFMCSKCHFDVQRVHLSGL